MKRAGYQIRVHLTDTPFLNSKPGMHLFLQFSVLVKVHNKYLKNRGTFQHAFYLIPMTVPKPVVLKWHFQTPKCPYKYQGFAYKSQICSTKFIHY